MNKKVQTIITLTMHTTIHVFFTPWCTFEMNMLRVPLEFVWISYMKFPGDPRVEWTIGGNSFFGQAVDSIIENLNKLSQMNHIKDTFEISVVKA